MIEINIQELKWKIKDDIYKCYYLVVIIIKFIFFKMKLGRAKIQERCVINLKYEQNLGLYILRPFQKLSDIQ